MTKTLDVYLYHDLVGHLTQNEHGQMIFKYAEDWLEKSDAIPLSHSLPLQKEPFQHQQCRGFFAGILPEENQRKIIAKNLGISARNDYAMLEQIGGECAGAITFLPFHTPLPERRDDYHFLTDADLAKTLNILPRRPLMAGDKDVRLSLAGTQDKIAVYVANDGRIAIPLNGAPSTHILKPAIPHLDGIVFNEAFCLKLADIVGLSAAKADIGRVDSIDYLLVERYDRFVDHTGNIQRIHQEDFCQALGITSEMKYQNEGGPSFKQCFDLVRHVSMSPVLDINVLLDAVIFNFLIGNHDAHGKNFSLLLKDKKIVGFAPLYDILSTVYYPELSKKMAMKIGGEYASDKIYPRHFEKFAEEAGLTKSMVVKHVSELAEIVITALDKVEIDHPVAHKISELIKARCQLTLKRFS